MRSDGGTELAREALQDVREGRLFSTYDADVVLDYFDGKVLLLGGNGRLCTRSDAALTSCPSLLECAL